MAKVQHERTDAQSQENLKRLAVIYEVYQGISQEMDMDVLVRKTLNLLQKNLEVDAMAVCFVEVDNQDLVLHSVLGMPQEIIAILARRKSGEGVGGRTVLTGRPHFIRVADLPNSNVNKVAFKHGFVEYDLIVSNKPVGTIVIANKNGRPILKKDQELLMGICSQLGAMLQNAQLSLAVDNEIAERAAELIIANKELAFQTEEKAERAAELIIANKELALQAEEKAERAAELIIANKELAFQNREKDKRASKQAGDALKQSEERYRLLVDNLADKKKPVHTDSNYGVFSEKTRQVIEQAQKYATNRRFAVLISGETGTGKEEIARITHGSDPSVHDKRPFVAINCAAITASLFESELFGYEPGAFTGGLMKGQIGKIQLAAGGTLFLDEIGEMPLVMQAKLLRVIQEKEFYRVGGLKTVKMDVRVICATNSNLLHAIAEGRFRKDLYYRLKVGHLYLFPLRERAKEIMPLAMMFLQYFAQQNGKKCNALGESAAKMLSVYDWPGNIRELRNVMEWATFMYDGVTLEAEHLGIIGAGDEMPGDCLKSPGYEAILTSGKLRNSTDQLVKQTLESCGGNKAAAARELGISRRALYRKLEKIDGKAYNINSGARSPHRTPHTAH